mmetsp:Transcript_38722/g.99021  ORF Transcript_38722/g.99021 Transcript_38722/m.99021 type:complete len:301 (-) Transcript_38722:109-1011(-)|eukprot:jgi/Tetstr1/421666/TSEL_012605.t1
MGKGGTRFVGEAIGHRTGRQKSTYTNKELRKNMDKYLETGVHPDFQPQSQSEVLQLPERDLNRPHVFLEFSVQGSVKGRVIIELFEDRLPTTVSQFRNRCSYGSSLWLKGTSIHRIQSGYALFGGKDTKSKTPTSSMRSDSRLKHAVFGAVSIAMDGSEFAIALGRSLKLDETHQVVGRVSDGLEVLEKLDDMITSEVDDSPLRPVVISRCGTCDAHGTHDSFDDSAPSTEKMSQKDTAKMLEVEAESTKEAVRDAVLSGLNKRKGEASSSQAPRKLPRGMMSGVLGDISSDSSSESEDD